MDRNNKVEKGREMKEKTKNNLLSRRQTLRLMGAAGATAVVAFASEPAARLVPAVRRSAVANAAILDCVVRPQLTEGPYFVDEKLNRSDIRTDPTTGNVSAGVPLILQFNVTGTGGGNCAPVPNAYVDIWHCDAAGAYSDVSNGAGQGNTSGRKYLRGYQVTDSNGEAQFTTIYPGWYSGRAVHIHFKIRLFSGSQETYEFTSQLFFNDTLSDQVYIQSPYNTRGTRNTRNSNDGIYNGGGSQLLLTLTPSGQGYAATFNIGLQGITGTTPAPGAAPVVTGASISGKHLIVTGANFSDDAIVFIDGQKYKKTDNDESSPSTLLLVRKAGKYIPAGQTVLVQVMNSDSTLSEGFSFLRVS
jgi:protocatechuate 3,4-dioxygenase beta subunit